VTVAVRLKDHWSEFVKGCHDFELGRDLRDLALIDWRLHFFRSG